jgi:plasmid replication initiation protein
MRSIFIYTSYLLNLSYKIDNRTMSETKIIRQDNSITNARYDFTACQLDILFCTMGQINDDDESNKVYVIYAKEIETLTGRQWQYAQFKEATESMGSRMFEIQLKDRYRQFWLFQRVDYITGQGCIQIKFTEDAIVLLKQLKNNFTTYELQSALSMSSKYAKRIYQICSQWKDVGQSKKFEIIELKKNLGLVDTKGEEQFIGISMFKKFALDVAVKQINQHSDLEISYEMEGVNGRKKPLKYITFYMKHKTPVMLPLQYGNNKDSDVRIQNLQKILHELGIVSPQIRETIINNEDFVKEVFSFNYQLQTGKIKADKNPGGLLLKKLGLV